jgi:hypothetical protein
VVAVTVDSCHGRRPDRTIGVPIREEHRCASSPANPRPWPWRSTRAENATDALTAAVDRAVLAPSLHDPRADDRDLLAVVRLVDGPPDPDLAGLDPVVARRRTNRRTVDATTPTDAELQSSTAAAVAENACSYRCSPRSSTAWSPA